MDAPRSEENELVRSNQITPSPLRAVAAAICGEGEGGRTKGRTNRELQQGLGRTSMCTGAYCVPHLHEDLGLATGRLPGDLGQLALSQAAP